MIYIRHATVVLSPSKAIKDAGILIKDKKIERIIAKGAFAPPRSARILSAKGRIVCPGLIDVHVQGAGGYDFLDGTKEAIANISRTLARFGTTSYLATTVFKNGANPHIENIVEERLKVKGERLKVKGAQLLGIHLEGPFVNPKKKGMLRQDGLSKCSIDCLNKILKLTNGKLKMMTIAPELKGAGEIIKKLRKKGIVVSFGHSDADYQETIKGINAGITHTTHIFNAMRPIHHREPGPLIALLTDDRVSIQVIADGVHIHPAVIKLIVRVKGIKNIVLITDSMSSQGLPAGKYIYDGWEYYSKKCVCKYKDGTLIGTALPLIEMIKRMVKFGGVSLPEALQMATINPARVLGIDNKKGSIEEGKDADLVIMDKNLDIYTTIINGEIIYKRG